MIEFDIKNIKILVCSVNAWNSKVGDNTFPLLLSDLPSENVASVFIREEQPDSPVCRHYFRISESRVIKSVFKRSVKTGEIVDCLTAPAKTVESTEYARLYSTTQKQRFYYAKLFAREIIWKFGKWRTNELDEFIDEFKPDVVLYEMSRYVHLNRIVRYIIAKTGAVGVGCFWDDTFTYKQENGFGYKALRFFQRKSIRKLVGSTTRFFAITPKTKKEADECFKIDCTVLTKPITTQNERTAPRCTKPLKMLYTGNLAIGREKTMCSLINALGKVNSAELQIYLDIYTKTQLSDEYVQAFNTAYSCLHDAVEQELVILLQNQADILLFIESLDDRAKIARLSFSTKITDYYAAGKCIFAIGNADLAPMELFAQENSAIVVTEEGELENALNRLLDTAIILEYADRAYCVGRERYTPEKVKTIFYSVLYRACLERRYNG